MGAGGKRSHTHACRTEPPMAGGTEGPVHASRVALLGLQNGTPGPTPTDAGLNVTHGHGEQHARGTPPATEQAR